MNEKSIEKEECNELKEKERMEEKGGLVERICIFDSNSIFSIESEHLECSKEKESELEKKEGNKSKKQKAIDPRDKSEVVSVFTNPTNSILIIDSSCVKNFLTQNRRDFFDLTAYLCFDHFLIETKLYLLALNFDRISLEHLCTLTLMLGRNHTTEFEKHGEIIEKRLSLCHVNT
ncbi:hypothetical protein M9H77_03289 [Catharanthus roseus]|uniref:Uncharacterized protein n=1 Tax=Catharanthus roseus TaxID=4058 RepID=A0ACC0CBB6_CATRO|nr:hypothetical protein M9H77_03289 [Catharanthus roseus]